VSGRDARWRAGGIREEPLRGWPSKEARHRRKSWLLDSRTARNQPLLDSRVGDPRADSRVGDPRRRRKPRGWKEARRERWRADGDGRRAARGEDDRTVHHGNVDTYDRLLSSSRDILYRNTASHRNHKFEEPFIGLRHAGTATQYFLGISLHSAVVRNIFYLPLCDYVVPLFISKEINYFTFYS
jgi:hypothetical protein